jgi:hypothetical protein
MRLERELTSSGSGRPVRVYAITAAEYAAAHPAGRAVLPVFRAWPPGAGPVRATSGRMRRSA